MKKALIITGIVLLVIIVILFTVPLLFTDQIAIMVRNKANENLNARVDFADVSLNMFENFPNLTLNIEDLTITNKEPFENDTLLSLEEFESSVSIWSLIAGDQIVVKKVKLIKPDIFVYVLEDSTANYNIFKDTTTTAVDTAESTTEMNLALEEYSIEDGNIAYVDQTSGTVAAVKGLNHSGSGDFSKGDFMLDTETNIKSLSVEMDGVTYLNKANVNLDMTLNANLNDRRFTLRENELKLNNLLMQFDGFVAMNEDDIVMDLTFGTKRSDFKDFISLIPAVYSNNFDDLQSKGKMGFSGFVKGIYNENRIPSFDIKLNVDNGQFKYPDLPTAINNVNVDLNVTNPGGTADNTVIDLKSLHLEIGKEPVDARLLVRNPQSNPFVDMQMKGHIDLGNLKNALTIEDITKLSGVIDADFQAAGTLPQKKGEGTENIKANGKISANNIIYAGKDMPQEIQIKQALLTLNPKQINLSSFIMESGKSDLRAEGTLNNMFSYFLSDGILSGNLKLTSTYFNVNPLLAETGDKQPATTGDSVKLTAVELPENVNFTMNSSFGTLVYDNLTMTNVKGTITLRDQRLNLNSLSMNMLGGRVIADGYYATPEGQSPQISFNLNIDNLSIRRSFESFVSIQQFAPMAKNVFGNFGAKLALSSSLGNDMKPVWNTFNSAGNLRILNAEIKDLGPLNAVADKLKINELKNPKITNINPSYKIEDGRFTISPFEYNFAGYKVSIGGSNGIDKTIDYIMEVGIPAGKLKAQANDAISNLLGRDVDLVGSGTIDVDVLIKGTMNNPDISTSVADIASETKQQIKEEVREQVTQEVEKQKEKVKEAIEEKADTLKEDLKEKAEEKIRDIFKR